MSEVQRAYDPALEPLAYDGDAEINHLLDEWKKSQPIDELSIELLYPPLYLLSQHMHNLMSLWQHQPTQAADYLDELLSRHFTLDSYYSLVLLPIKNLNSNPNFNAQISPLYRGLDYINKLVRRDLGFLMHISAQKLKGKDETLVMHYAEVVSDLATLHVLDMNIRLRAHI
jgi:hypothetical protein